jgi:hypothetical protein
LWKWGEDTYHTGYKIFTIFFTQIIDIYLFYYKQGSYIPKHKDPPSNKKIYRLNIELVKAKKGGQFICKKMIWSKWNRIYLFRADNSYHYVTPVEQGYRLLLSCGLKINK